MLFVLSERQQPNSFRFIGVDAAVLRQTNEALPAKTETTVNLETGKPEAIYSCIGLSDVVK